MERALPVGVVSACSNFRDIFMARVSFKKIKKYTSVHTDQHATVAANPTTNLPRDCAEELPQKTVGNAELFCIYIYICLHNKNIDCLNVFLIYCPPIRLRLPLFRFVCFLGTCINCTNFQRLNSKSKGAVVQCYCLKVVSFFGVSFQSFTFSFFYKVHHGQKGRSKEGQGRSQG